MDKRRGGPGGYRKRVKERERGKSNNNNVYGKRGTGSERVLVKMRGVVVAISLREETRTMYDEPPLVTLKALHRETFLFIRITLLTTIVVRENSSK